MALNPALYDTSDGSQKDDGQYEAVSSAYSAAPLRTTSFRPWKPFSLRPPFLIGTIAICCALIAALIVLHLRSIRDDGLLFGVDINDLPSSKTFGYLILPTIISVLFSLMWAWIDLDTKRIEPFYQLSTSGGASAKNSLLLHYPVDFMASVPINAIKNKHSMIFCASLAIVLVFWGLTPTQAGIFSVETINKTLSVPILSSTSYVPIPEQKELLLMEEVYSAANILWWNETLPEFTTRDYALAPFAVEQPLSTVEDTDTLTGETRLFSLDIFCEQAVVSGINITNGDSDGRLTSSWGCDFQRLYPLGPGMNVNETDKIYSMFYVGFFSPEGFSDYYLSPYCPKNESSTFLTMSAKIKVPKAQYENFTNAEKLQNADTTTLYCRPSYFTQRVEATISLSDRRVISSNPLGPKEPFPAEMFNTTDFETSMNQGTEAASAGRSNFPTNSWPGQKTKLANTLFDSYYTPRLVPFALGATMLPEDDYMVPEVLRKSFESAYRVLFARRLASILKDDLDPATRGTGTRTYGVQAIVTVPAFIGIVVGVLGVICILSCCLLYMSLTRHLKLERDPSTISALMDMVAGQDAALAAFKDLDTVPVKNLETAVEDKKFHIAYDPTSAGLKLSTEDEGWRGTETLLPGSQAHGRGEWKKVLPKELTLVAGTIFFIFQIAAFGVILGIYLWSISANGESQHHCSHTSLRLPLPSENQFVRQFVTNYLPTALGALIEPAWLVLNRLLCMLQSFEDMRKGYAEAKSSIKADYNSYPPQFSILRSIRNRHFLLSAVCVMTLLANVLPVALSSLFYEQTVPVPAGSTFVQPFTSNFKALNGTGQEFNFIPQYMGQGSTTQDAFYVAMSNITAKTPLPPWADEAYTYIPFEGPSVETNMSFTHRAKTTYFGSKLDCAPVEKSGPTSYQASLDRSRFSNPTAAPMFQFALNVTFTQNVQEPVTCVANISTNVAKSNGPSALEFTAPLFGGPDASDEVSRLCESRFLAGWLRANVAEGEKAKPRDPPPFSVTDRKELIMACVPTIVTGEADVEVDTTGRVLRRHSVQLSSDIASHFTTTPLDLIQQANQFIVGNGDMVYSPGEETRRAAAAVWHNDTFPSDFTNYLMTRTLNNSAFLDPATPPPTYADISNPFTSLYSTLFAILVAINQDLLLVPASSTPAQSLPVVAGLTNRPERRLFLHRSMVALALVILAVYAFTTVLVYLKAKQKWGFLPRLPTSIASILAYVAASTAVKAKTGIQMAPRPRGERYGLGRFTGSDNRPHWGIETADRIELDAVDTEILGMKRRATTWNDWTRRGKLATGESEIRLHEMGTT
ncbi:hypothetical protein P152DRAFT_433421 [Eremomyces bilateralis CBS 781.70]|uniref:Uncharacterized protein n=1 Tax=Eremomyces bilateralis CBS 781.70 TaxID=1392243 RepID=A0A6G1G759_9PEZI|nr:uncharacterized protein P152DRAFT_433421 [Eremomyces bilateralis CBS 781.70]KAF1813864.1 hypothetical protein P152DRAFT_433421 [Eremomyces bilateralis CBS 781.70]